MLVHLDLALEMLPDDYMLVRASLPEGSTSTIAAMADDPRAAGGAWLSGNEAAMLRVPSVLVPHAWNLLLNPTHPAAADAHIAAEEPFRFDRRLRLMP